MAAPTFFATPAAFRTWLQKHHAGAAELLVGFHKKDSGRPSMSWPEAVDEALCHGWIDGVRKRVDEHSYTIRFTPRRTRSIWSAVNIARVAELSQQGLMQPAGLAAFGRREEARSRVYSHERKVAAVLTAAHQRAFEAETRAWAYFSAQAPSYVRSTLHWIESAKAEATQVKRLAALIAASARHERLR